ncbi:MAG TPA: trypsin-like peptidase domain-containing protein [Hyphomicrobiaceae bacterium]|nr:trypsin-like peptidase domain-containing protein [Hyphomicrobiaceae bacterium]
MRSRLMGLLEKIGLLSLALLIAMGIGGTRLAQSQSSDADEIKVLQYLLLWSGDYAGQIDGFVDPMLQQAVRDFQARAGVRDKAFDSGQAKQLVDEATQAAKRVGYAYILDEATKAHVALPRDILSDGKANGKGSRFTTTDNLVEVETIRYEPGGDVTLLQLYRKFLEPLDRSALIQNSFRGDHFVLAWFVGSRQHLVRMHDRSGEVRGIEIRFDRNARSAFYPIAVAMVHDYSPFAPQSAVAALRQPKITSTLAPSDDPPPRGEPRRGRPGPGNTGPIGPSPRRGSVSISSGSGFIVSPRGHILTNAHVVDDCTSISTGIHKSVKLVGIDKRNDLALLLPPGTPPPNIVVAKFASEAVRLGEDVATFGFPLRDILADQLNMTTGIVSSLAGLRGDPKFIQISAPVQRGNSGGPVVDLAGRVIGVVTAKLDALGIAKASGGDLPQVVNFAVRHELGISFMRRYGVEPILAPETEAMRKRDLAKLAADFTLAITCEKR